MPIFIVFDLTRPGIESESTVSEADALSTNWVARVRLIAAVLLLHSPKPVRVKVRSPAVAKSECGCKKYFVIKLTRSILIQHCCLEVLKAPYLQSSTSYSTSEK